MAVWTAGTEKVWSAGVGPTLQCWHRSRSEAACPGSRSLLKPLIYEMQRCSRHHSTVDKCQQCHWLRTLELLVCMQPGEHRHQLRSAPSPAYLHWLYTRCLDTLSPPELIYQRRPPSQSHRKVDAAIVWCVFERGCSARADFIFDLSQAGAAWGCERRPVQTAVKELLTRWLQTTRAISHHRVNKPTSPQKKKKNHQAGLLGKSACLVPFGKTLRCFSFVLWTSSGTNASLVCSNDTQTKKY